NVWLSREGQSGRKVVLTAIDHTHCFGNGTQLTAGMASISAVRDERGFGRFPEFAAYLDKAAMQATCATLAAVTKEQLEPLVNSIPDEWEVAQSVRAAWLELLVQRASYVAATLIPKVFPES